MRTMTAKENRMLGLMISYFECPPEDPDLLPKYNFGGCGKIPTTAVARSGILERTEVLHLVVVRVQHDVARVSLSSHEGSSPPRGIPSMLFINRAMLVIMWVYGLCQVVDMDTMLLMISWD